MTTAWYSHWPLSHPWMSSLKRKHPESSPDPDSTSSSSSDIESSTSAPRNLSSQASTPGTPRKRRRYDLARNLSQLSLFEQTRVRPQAQPDTASLSTQDVNITPWSHTPPTDMMMDADADGPVLDVVHPIVEEPSDVGNTIPEVHMHNSSSYEPEKDRIIITDLDSSEDEADTPPHTPGGKVTPYSVSPAFLSHIKASRAATPLMKPISLIPDSDHSRALILFTPSPWVAKDPRELEGIYRARDADRETSLDHTGPDGSEVDADAMEVE